MLYGKSDFLRCDKIKGLEIGKLCWFIEVDSKCHHKCSYKKQTEEDLTQKRRPCEGSRKKLMIPKQSSVSLGTFVRSFCCCIILTNTIGNELKQTTFNYSSTNVNIKMFSSWQ